MNYGMEVRCKMRPCYTERGGSPEIVLHNVTEIHYNFDSLLPHITGVMIAFESDLHGTGMTMQMNDLYEFETRCEPDLAEAF